MHVDFKLTTWQRLVIPEEHEAEARELLTSGQINDASDLMSKLGLDNVPESIDDTEEQMVPSENGGCETIDAFNENGEESFYNNAT